MKRRRLKVFLLLIEKTPVGVFASLKAAKAAAARDRARSVAVIAAARARGAKWLEPPPQVPVLPRKLRWVQGPQTWTSAGFQSTQNGERYVYSIWATALTLTRKR